MAIRRLFIVWMIVIILSLLTACQSSKNTILSSSKLFYIHDLDHTLLNATSWTIFNYGETLYNDSKASEIAINIQGSQVVILTYTGDPNAINSTEIFNSWGIGEHNMGILFILFFNKLDDIYIYDSMIVEIGTQMSEHLSAFTANDLVSTYFNDPNISSFDYDARIVSLYHGFLSYIYLNIYNYSSYDHQSFMDDYYTYQYDYIRAIPTTTYYDILLSSVWFWVIVIAIVILGGSIFHMLPLFYFTKSNRFNGGGGKSIGYWFKR